MCTGTSKVDKSFMQVVGASVNLSHSEWRARDKECIDLTRHSTEHRGSLK